MRHAFMLLASALLACAPTRTEHPYERADIGTQGAPSIAPEPVFVAPDPQVPQTFVTANEASDEPPAPPQPEPDDKACESASLDGILFIQALGTDAHGRSVSWTGTGIIVANDGTTLTARHVIEKAEHVVAYRIRESAELTDGRHYKLESFMFMSVIRSSKRRDVALLKPTHPVQLPMRIEVRRSLPNVGERVCHLGISSEKAAGNVTELHSVSNAPGMVVKDVIAASIPTTYGDSGGPLLNDKGEALGICLSFAFATGTAYFYPVGEALQALRYSPPRRPEMQK